MVTPSSAQRSQPKRDAGLDRERGHLGREHARPGTRRPASSNSSQHGMDTTRTAMPSSASRLGGLDADAHLAAGADQHEVGSSPPASTQHVRAPGDAVGAACPRAPAGPGGSARARSGRRASTATRQAAAVSLASAGRITRRPGMARSAGEVLDRLVGRARPRRGRPSRGSTSRRPWPRDGGEADGGPHVVAEHEERAADRQRRRRAAAMPFMTPPMPCSRTPK